MNYRGKKTLCELCGKEVRQPKPYAKHHFCWRCHSYRGAEVRAITYPKVVT